jgi:hypothetical protein
LDGSSLGQHQQILDSTRIAPVAQEHIDVRDYLQPTVTPGDHVDRVSVAQKELQKVAR